MEVGNIVKLIIPRMDMKYYFDNMVKDYIENDLVLEGRSYFEDDFNFEEYINYLKERRSLPSDSLEPVQQYEWWLIDENNNIAGTSRLRMSLESDVDINEEGNIGYDIAPSFRNKGFGSLILKLTLNKAKSFGFDKIFITCSENNPASKKIIENNGGVLHSKFYSEEDQEYLLRFWIHIK